MPSILSFLLVTAALSVVMLLVLWSLRGSRVAGISEWMQASLLAVLALPLLGAFGRLPGLLTVELPNGMLILGNALMLIAFRRHLGQSLPTHLLSLTGLAALAGLAYFHLAYDSQSLRIVVASLFHSGIFFAIWRSIPATRAAQRRYAYRYTRGTALVLALSLVLRACSYTLQVSLPPGSFDSSIVNLAFFAFSSVALPALTLGAVMMAHAQLLCDSAYAADHDDLTGAWSRRAFFRIAEREHARSLRHGSVFSLVVFDADHFKRINDTHGHAGGDQVLRELVARAQQVIRKIDYCARLGGEEFAVLLPDTDEEAAFAVAQRLRAILDGELALTPLAPTIPFTVSIGVATLATPEDIASLMVRADRALYVAKAGGRNQVVAAASVVPAPRINQGS